MAMMLPAKGMKRAKSRKTTAHILGRRTTLSAFHNPKHVQSPEQRVDKIFALLEPTMFAPKDPYD